MNILCRSLLLICLFSSASCHRDEKKTNLVKPKFNEPVVPEFKTAKRDMPFNELYGFIPYSPKQHQYIFKSGKPASLNKQEIELIEDLIVAYIKKEERKFEKNTRDYAKQFIAIINAKGEKVVWTNCLCHLVRPNPLWNKEVEEVNDGGDCYFSLFINLTTGKCYNLYVNGLA